MFGFSGTIGQRSREIRAGGGLRVHLGGAPLELVMPSDPVRAVALCGADLPGIRPEFRVAPGDTVRLGQTVLVDRKRPEIRFTAPAAGTVSQIRHGSRRVLEALVIETGEGEATEFRTDGDDPEPVLLESGMWTAFLTRPFGRIPDPGSRPHMIFVTAMDTRPLSPDPMIAIEEHGEYFRRGIAVLSRLSPQTIHVCHAPGKKPALREDRRLRLTAFRGSHPAGLAGTHIHHLAPVGNGRTVWNIDYPGVIAIGHLFVHGRLMEEKIISVAGPGVANPGLMRVRPGARIADIVAAELKDEAVDILSGDVFSGRRSEFLGQRHNQITVLADGGQLSFGRLAGLRARILPGVEDTLPLPVDALQRALPRDIPAVPLLRALHAGDAIAAGELGCLDLIEEDLALLPHLGLSRADYGILLRRVLDELSGKP